MEYIPTQSQSSGETPLPVLSLETVREHYFGKRAFDYDIGREKSAKWQKEHEAVKKSVADLSGKLLDIPCGTGCFFPIYRGYNLDFVGMDVSEDMMMQARTKDPDALVTYGDISQIPLPDKAVECSVCIRFLEKLPEQQMAQILKELGRVTSRRIVCSNIIGDAATQRRRSWIHRYNVFEKGVYDAGFQIRYRLPIRDPEMNVWVLEAA